MEHGRPWVASPPRMSAHSMLHGLDLFHSAGWQVLTATVPAVDPADELVWSCIAGLFATNGNNEAVWWRLHLAEKPEKLLARFTWLRSHVNRPLWAGCYYLAVLVTHKSLFIGWKCRHCEMHGAFQITDRCTASLDPVTAL